MRFKPLPEPPESLSAVAAAQRAVPLVPGSEEDCCGRLLRRRDLPSRDVARTWLTFLRALELAEETDSGFRRTDREPAPEAVRTAFLDRVYGAEETLDVLRAAEAPLSADEAFERLRESIPQWERYRKRTWETEWRERVAHLLDWLVLLGLAESVDSGYRAAD